MTSGTSSEIEVIATRVARLERQNRRAKYTVAFLVLAFAVALWAGTKPSRILDVEGIVIRDDHGIERINLGLFEQGQPTRDGLPMLVLRARDGSRRAAMLVSGTDTANLLLVDQNQERPAIWMSALDGAPLMAMFDRAGQERATLAIADDGVPELAFLSDPTTRCGDTDCESAAANTSPLIRDEAGISR